MTTDGRTNGLMTIGEAARAAGVAAPTLRYYEERGILAPTSRNHAGYRLYDERAVDQLRFIRSAQAVGFTLDDVQALCSLSEDESQSCQSEVQELLERRLDDVRTKMRELRRVATGLRRALDRCRGSEGKCAVLQELRRPTKTRRQKI